MNAETYAESFGKVYTFGPTFRAENSNTVKHAAEFWMVEPEICFANLDDDMDLAEDMIQYIFSYVMEHCPEEMNFFYQFIDKTLEERLKNVVNSKFVRISYTERLKNWKRQMINSNTKCLGVSICKQNMKDIYVRKYLKNLYL